MEVFNGAGDSGQRLFFGEGFVGRLDTHVPRQVVKLPAKDLDRRFQPQDALFQSLQSNILPL